uniref:Golgi associated, gamma adaptin ear containing, ARF binding protein 2 n=1 Tax=Nothobranchius furzeri TaxID=105023 RepID=A0A8C6KWH5_NOTFU
MSPIAVTFYFTFVFVSLIASDKATDPNNEEDRWDCIQGFYQLVNQEADGPHVALRLLAHKIQSPQEKEALQALTVLEACMNNCGKRFHSEAAKFRFLNELIKVLTPKYFGAWSPQKVKERVTEVFYGWTLWLKEEPKIQEAYNMLKKQGIVKKDPTLPDTVVMAPPPQRTTESVFDQDDKAKMLARLLKSGRPEDLETANRLIKSTIKEEQEKAEKVSKRESTLMEVESSTKQLRELLYQHIDTETSFQPSDDVKALYECCDQLRPRLFRLASDSMDDDAALAQILAANDELTLVLNAYKDLMAGGKCNRGRTRSKTPTSPREIKSYHLIDLSALDSPQTHRKADSPPVFESSSPFSSHSESNCSSEAEKNLGEPAFISFHFDISSCDDGSCVVAGFKDLVSKQTQQNPKSYYEELMQSYLFVCPVRSLPHLQQVTESGSPTTTQKPLNRVSGSPLKLEESSSSLQTLKDIFVPLETIRFCQMEPVTVYNQVGIHVSLHFARDRPSGHPEVAVVVMSAVNTSALHVEDFVFQVAASKGMLVKLQPVSRTHLPPYNPLLPPPSVSQVILLANPQGCKVRLRYKLTLTHGGQRLSETGEIDSLPDWTAMIKL